jgi:hypothetical protein
VAHKLTDLSPQLIQAVANHLEHEGKYSNLPPDGYQVLEVLKHVNTIAARILGSQASNILVRNEIRSYMGFFGVPHIYLTMNPNPGHSPIFQVMFGDEAVDLSTRFPELAPTGECAYNLQRIQLLQQISLIFQYPVYLNIF